MVCVSAGSDLQSFSGDCFARGWWDFKIPWVSDDAYGPHRVHKAAVASGRHMNVALPHISAPSFMVCDIAAGVVRDMQHDSSPAFMMCDFAAAGALRDMQHDSSPAFMMSTLQQGACGICSMIQTVRLALARVGGPSAQEHDLLIDPERMHDAYRPHSVWL